MAKKRNYENDEAYKNFRVEDFLPEMKWREPEAKASTTKETVLLPSVDEPGTSAMQDIVSDAGQHDKPEIRDTPNGETAEKTQTKMSMFRQNGLSPDASAASSVGCRWRSTAPPTCKSLRSPTASPCSLVVRFVTGWMRLSAVSEVGE